MGDWSLYAVCPSCGHKEDWDFRWTNNGVCKGCGQRNGGSTIMYDDWKMKTLRWVSTVVWYKPKTWGTGYWEEKQ